MYQGYMYARHHQWILRTHLFFLIFYPPESLGDPGEQA